MQFRWVLSIVMLLAAVSCSAPTTEVPGDAYTRLSPDFTGEFELVDTRGAALNKMGMSGKIGVFYFGFTSCPGICQNSLRLLGAAHSQLTEQEREKLRTVFITVDPERDTAERVAAFLRDYPFLAEGKALTPAPEITGLTGEPGAVKKAMEAFKMAAWRQELEGSALEYTMNHMDAFYITDRQGQPIYLVHASVTPAQLAQIIRWNL